MLRVSKAPAAWTYSQGDVILVSLASGSLGTPVQPELPPRAIQSAVLGSIFSAIDSVSVLTIPFVVLTLIVSFILSEIPLRNSLGVSVFPECAGL